MQNYYIYTLISCTPLKTSMLFLVVSYMFIITSKYGNGELESLNRIDSSMGRAGGWRSSVFKKSKSCYSKGIIIKT